MIAPSQGCTWKTLSILLYLTKHCHKLLLACRAGKCGLASEGHCLGEGFGGRQKNQWAWKPLILVNLGEQEKQVFIWFHQIFRVTVPNQGFDFSYCTMISWVWFGVLLVFGKLWSWSLKRKLMGQMLRLFLKLVTGAWLNSARAGIRVRQITFQGVIYLCSWNRLQM